MVSFKHLITNISKEIVNSVKILEKLYTQSGLNPHPPASNSACNPALISDLCTIATCS